MKTALFGVLAFFSAIGAGHADDFTPFRLMANEPKAIMLDGPIDERSALAFKRVMRAAPEATVLLLNSPGGSVHMALLIADDVHARGMATIVPQAGSCDSACAFVFLAGNIRYVIGRLGVHQIYGIDSVSDAQTSLSDIIETLNSYGVRSGVITTMLRTPPEAMHYFTKEELMKWNIATHWIDETEAASPPDTSDSAAADPDPEQLEAFRSLAEVGPVPFSREEALRSKRATELMVAAAGGAADLKSLGTNAYADFVRFNGNLLPRGAVIFARSNRVSSWSSRNAQIIDGTVVDVCTAGVCMVSAMVETRGKEPGSGKELRMVERVTMRFSSEEDSKVVEETVDAMP
ncbi:hypothetical protein DEM27_28720 [Metarhizobium album]|uniref:Periplasmic protein-like protein n=1 Tax=Metarhizobium album TaxID=2182425 RepID=A0A2U2DHP3_9HYPH|nr:hypothetical protein [Rhizobium album]PWE52788.1 hypothetical protein DEM27_28720 [Rhizobium album]